MAGAAARSFRLSNEAARLRDRAALARARGDTALADSLLDVSRRNARQARRLRKEAKASGEIKTSAGGEAFDKLARAAKRRAFAAVKSGDLRAEKAARLDADMYSRMAVQSYQADGIRSRRVVRAEGSLAAEYAAAEAKKLEARRKRDARVDAAAAKHDSPEERAKRLERAAHKELWAKKRGFWAQRRAEKARRLRVMRGTQQNMTEQFNLAQQDVARGRAQATREATKREKALDERYGELHETPEESESRISKLFPKLHAAAGIVSILQQRSKDKAAQHERKMRFDPVYRAKVEKAAAEAQAKYDKTRRGRAKIAVRAALGRGLDRLSKSRVAIRQENADEAKAKTELAEAKKAAKGLRATLKHERMKLKIIREAYATAPTPAQRAEGRAALAIQRDQVKAARDAVNGNVAKGKNAKATLERVTEARETRRTGTIGYKLGAPTRKVRAMASAANQKFQVALLSFKVKYGIDKPILPWQRDSLFSRKGLMQRAFGSDKGYKGKTYHAKGALGMGDAAILAGRGQQGVHPEDAKDASRTPGLHKGKKGGVYYIGPKGKKVYISHGGVMGFIGAFRSGLRGHRLLH